MTATENAINRVLRAHGLPELGTAGVVIALASLVENHQHLTELLRACEPWLRREMYEGLRPYLRFPARPLDWYISAAQEFAEAAELPTMNAAGGLDPYTRPVVTTEQEEEEEKTEDDEEGEGKDEDDENDDEDDRAILLVFCYRCRKEAQFSGERIVDAIQKARRASWGIDESVAGKHLCPECLDAVD